MRLKTSVGGMLFLSAYLMMLADGILIGFSTLGELRGCRQISLALRGMAAGFVVMKVFLDRRYLLSDILKMLALGAALLLAFYRSRYNHLFYVLLLMIGMRGVDARRLIRIDLWARIVMMAFVMLLALTHTIENYALWRPQTQSFRYSLGFSQPNTLAALAFGVVLEEAWLNDRNPSWLYAAFVWGLSATLYGVTGNRTAVILLAAFPLCLCWKKWRARRGVSRLTQCAGMAAYPILAAFSFIVMKGTEGVSWVSLLDGLFSARFANAARLYAQYGCSLFGQRVELTSLKMAQMFNVGLALLDVAYLRLMIEGGLLAFTVYMLLYMNGVRRSARRRSAVSILALCLFAVFGVMESGANNPCMNFTMILMAEALYCHGDEQKSEAQHGAVGAC